MFKKFIVVVISVITYVSCTEHFIEKKSSAQQLLESLGQKTNYLDPNFGTLLQEFIKSESKVDITPGQFISTFYNSLTRESTLVLLSLPLFFSVLAGFALLISIPSLATYLLKRNLDRQDGEYSTLDQEYVLSNLDENYFDDAFDEPRYYI